jgi:hypothetical protein
VERLHALIGWLGEPGADCIVHTQRFDLPSVSLLINDNRWVNVGTVLSPVSNFIINLLIVGVFRFPIGFLTRACETLLNAIKCVLKVELESLMSTSGTVDIYHTIASPVYFVNVIPPHGSVVYRRR